MAKVIALDDFRKIKEETPTKDKTLTKEIMAKSSNNLLCDDFEFISEFYLEEM